MEKTHSQDESNEQKKVLLRTCFLYFFRLMSFKDQENDASLDILFELVNNNKPRKSSVKNKDMTKAQMDALDFDTNNIVFMISKTNKGAQKHIRGFKRFFKILTSNLVDVFPDKKEHLTSLVTAILNYSQCK